MLAFLLISSCFMTAVPAFAATSYSGLNSVQTYFNRVIGSLSRKDYYDTDVLASITLAQAVYESGWARYGLGAGGKNLFGIKAYNTWSGLVFDANGSMLYASYDDFLLAKGQSYINTFSAWRAYFTWGESVDSHSSLFVNDSKYKAVVGEKDYSKAAYAIVAAGYCSDNGYAATVVKCIEQYGMTEYDDLTADGDGVIGIVSQDEQVWLDIGNTYSMSVTAYPEGKTPSSVTWKSDNTAVATVDDKGNVKALAHGMTLISATLSNGREACCIVYVNCNATVIESDVYVRTSPSSTASDTGKISRGMPILVTSDNVYTDSAGKSYYAVRGYNSKGTLVTGYALSDYIYRNIRGVQEITAVSDSVTLKTGSSYTPVLAVAPADATDKTLSWKSSNTSVASVKDGVITAVSAGSASITATAPSGVKKVISVTVATSVPEKRAIISSYETVTVRNEPNASAGSPGRILFLSEVKVHGAPEGLWYKISGTTIAGKAVTGYVHSAYVRVIPDDAVVTRGTVSDTVKVYEKTDNQSQSYGALVENSSFVSISTGNGDWKFVIGVKNPGNLKAIYGYAIPGAVIVTPTPDPNSPSGYYGRTTSNLRVRSGAGTNYESLGILTEGTQIVVIGDIVNGWYYVRGTDSDGEDIAGYCSADYVALLYHAVTTQKLNVRSEPATSGSIVGTFSLGAEITVIGSASDGWYSVEGTDYSTRKAISGYSSATYITIKGLYEAEGYEGFGLTDDSLLVSDGRLLGISPGTTAEQLGKAFQSTVTVSSQSGVALSSDAAVYTGCKVSFYSGGTLLGTLNAVVRGDASGDGKTSAEDYLMIKRSFLGTYTLSGDYLLAALVSGSAKLSIADYVMVKRAVLGTFIL